MDVTLRRSMVRPELAGALRRCAEICTETLERYQRRGSASASRRFVSSLLLAGGALETAAEALAGDPLQRESSLTIAVRLCRDAAEAIRAHGLDEDLLRCAEACERAAHLCEQALASPKGQPALQL